MNKLTALSHCWIPNKESEPIHLYNHFNSAPGGLDVLKKYISGERGDWSRAGDWFLINDAPSYHFNERKVLVLTF